MKKILTICVLLAVCLSVVSCGPGKYNFGFDAPDHFPPLETKGPNNYYNPEDPEQTAGETTAPPPPAHSELYIRGIATELMMNYFAEICIDGDVDEEGKLKGLQRWTDPIYYVIYGECTDEDKKTIEEFCEYLNSIEGFPGIHESKDYFLTNFEFYFGSENDMVFRLGPGFAGADAGMLFRDEQSEIYEGVICLRTDIDQKVRNSAIVRQLCKVIGATGETDIREDSVFYTEYGENISLNDVDKVILQLFYHTKMLTGLDYVLCERIIEKLYY